MKKSTILLSILSILLSCQIVGAAGLSEGRYRVIQRKVGNVVKAYSHLFFDVTQDRISVSYQLYDPPCVATYSMATRSSLNGVIENSVFDDRIELSGSDCKKAGTQISRTDLVGPDFVNSEEAKELYFLMYLMSGEYTLREKGPVTVLEATYQKASCPDGELVKLRLLRKP